MKKTAFIISIILLCFMFPACSIDQSEMYEEKATPTDQFYSKNARSGDEAPMFEGCTIEYTFNNPYLTPAEKAAVRNSYGFVISYVVVDYDTEIWYVDCTGYHEYELENPDCDGNGCYVQTSGCPRAGCGSTNPKPDGPTNPFGNDQ